MMSYKARPGCNYVIKIVEVIACLLLVNKRVIEHCFISQSFQFFNYIQTFFASICSGTRSAWPRFLYELMGASGHMYT